MPADAVRKRCTECRHVATGTSGKPQWCDRCGGEMRPVIYGRPRRKVRR